MGYQLRNSSASPTSTGHLDFDCHRYIRLLGRLGFLLPEAQRPAWSLTQLIAGRRSAHPTTF
jgi:hypothetical protein